MAVKAFPKGKGRFQLELQRRSWAPPASDPSVLVATRHAFEHSIPDVFPRSWRRRARFKQYKRLYRAADILAETDTQNLEALFRRSTTGILRLPTYAGANLRADRALSKFSLPMQSHARRAIFRAVVTESRRALATRGRVGRRLPTSPPPTYLLVYSVVAVCYQVHLSLRCRWCIDLCSLRSLYMFSPRFYQCDFNVLLTRHRVAPSPFSRPSFGLS
ncbi:hypothetical protein K525DRAFT_275706 [Schizophyllum commune Loenen D]|nr:hypothetical protein K525DRAFT_275706 [Schizophyllum commune Loenen D]